MTFSETSPMKNSISPIKTERNISRQNSSDSITSDQGISRFVLSPAQSRNISRQNSSESFTSNQGISRFVLSPAQSRNISRQNSSDSITTEQTKSQNNKKKTYIKYSLMVHLFIIFLSCILIRIYGNTCGISILYPSSWLSSFLLVGSPYCRGLNWATNLTSGIVENLWFHLISNLLTSLYLYIPNN